MPDVNISALNFYPSTNNISKNNSGGMPLFKSMRVIKAIAALCILTALFVPAGCGKGNKNSEAELQSAQGQKSE